MLQTMKVTIKNLTISVHINPFNLETMEVEMSTARITRIFVGAILIAAVVLVFKAIGPQVAAVSTNMAPVGIGELRSYEAAQSGRSTGLGLGDLRFFEASQSRAAGSVSRSSSSAGFGQLRLLEAQQAAELASTTAYAGMGDLRFFEAHQNGR